MRTPAIAAAALAPALLLLAAAPAARAADVPGNATTKATLPIRTQATPGVWEGIGDSDWYRVTLEKGQAYAGRLDAAGDAAAYTIFLRDAHGRAVAGLTRAAGKPSPGFEYVAPAGGTYYVDALLNSTGPGQAAAYAVGLAPDCAAGARTTCRLSVGAAGQQRRQIFFPGDVDWFRVDLAAGAAYRFEASKADGRPLALGLDLVDEAGKVLRPSVAAPGGARAITGFVPPKAGAYYVRVRGADKKGTGAYLVEAGAG